MIFVNLPVTDLPASRAFFSELGFSFNPAFSDDSCACMVVDRNIFVMLLVRDKFRELHQRRHQRRHPGHRGADLP